MRRVLADFSADTVGGLKLPPPRVPKLPSTIVIFGVRGWCAISPMRIFTVFTSAVFLSMPLLGSHLCRALEVPAVRACASYPRGMARSCVS